MEYLHARRKRLANRATEPPLFVQNRAAWRAACHVSRGLIRNLKALIGQQQEAVVWKYTPEGKAEL
jgi:hypothetical protein